MAQKRLRWVKGNYIKLAIPLVEEYVSGGNKETRKYAVPDGSTVCVNLIGERHRVEFKNLSGDNISTTETEPRQSTILIDDNGTIPADIYAVEVTVVEPDTAPYNGHKLRSMWSRSVEVACDNSPKEAEQDGFLGDGSVELEAAVFYSTNGPTVSEGLVAAYSRMGYYVCDTAGNAMTKVVDDEYSVNYRPGNGGSMRVKMLYKNEATTQVGLQINYVENGQNNYVRRPLFYNGKRVDATNTWDADEIIEVFDDGTQFQASNAFGGGVFHTTEKVTHVSISRETSEVGDVTIPTVGKMNAAITSAVATETNNRQTAINNEATLRQNGLDQKENLINKVTSVNADSTDVQYPTAKALYYERMARQDADVQLQSQINEIVGGNATVGLTVSQSAIFANTETKVNVKATSSIDADSISISRDGTEIATAVNDHELEKKNVSLNLAGGTSATFSAAFVIKGVNKPEQTKTVTAYDKIYYGTGTENNHANLTPVGTVKTSAAGTYSFTFTPQSDKKYIYILIPKTMSPSNPPIDLTKVKLPSGFGYNLQLVAQNEDYNGDGVLYYVYRSVDYNNQNVTLIIS